MRVILLETPPTDERDDKPQDAHSSEAGHQLEHRLIPVDGSIDACQDEEDGQCGTEDGEHPDQHFLRPRGRRAPGYDEIDDEGKEHQGDQQRYAAREPCYQIDHVRSFIPFPLRYPNAGRSDHLSPQLRERGCPRPEAFLLSSCRYPRCLSERLHLREEGRPAPAHEHSVSIDTPLRC